MANLNEQTRCRLIRRASGNIRTSVRGWAAARRVLLDDVDAATFVPYTLHLALCADPQMFIKTASGENLGSMSGSSDF